MFRKKNITEMTKKINKYVKKIKKAVKRIAERTKFIERKSNSFYKKEFKFIVLVAFETAKGKSLKEAAEDLKIYYKTEMTKQGLEYKLKSDKTLIFIENVYKYLLKSNLNGLEEIIKSKITEKFSNIYLEDSTIIKLNEKHKENYKGSNKKAEIKINLMYNGNKTGIKNINIEKGTTSELKISENNLNLLKEKDLILRDLGYYKISSFKKITEQKAYFISKHKFGTVTRLETGEKIDNLYLYMKNQNKEILDFNILLGDKEKTPVRIVAYKMPDDIYKKRVEKASKHSQKKKNKDISERYKNELKYSVFITNIPLSVLPSELVGTLYKYRWEIELIFKELKSVFNLDNNYSIKNENRLKTNIYLKLIAFMLLAPLKNMLLSTSVFSQKQEVSSFVLSHWLLYSVDIILVFSKNRFKQLFSSFFEHFSLFLMDNIYRYSLKNIIFSSVNFSNTFSKPPKSG